MFCRHIQKSPKSEPPQIGVIDPGGSLADGRAGSSQRISWRPLGVFWGSARKPGGSQGLPLPPAAARPSPFWRVPGLSDGCPRSRLARPLATVLSFLAFFFPVSSHFSDGSRVPVSVSRSLVRGFCLWPWPCETWPGNTGTFRASDRPHASGFSFP